MFPALFASREQTQHLIIIFAMKCILGIKRGMTQIFDDNGVCHPATVIEATPATVAAVRSKEQDGYTALQLQAGTQKEARLSKAHRGKHGTARFVKEFRSHRNDKAVAEIAAGTDLSVDQFVVGDTVTVSAVSKGKGFQGVVKRHNFAGGPKTHGNKHHERAPGSIGATGPARVFKGTKMAGRMGGDQVTVKNLRVVQVQPDTHLILLRGAVPGHNGTLVEVQSR